MASPNPFWNQLAHVAAAALDNGVNSAYMPSPYLMPYGSSGNPSSSSSGGSGGHGPHAVPSSSALMYPNEDVSDLMDRFATDHFSDGYDYEHGNPTLLGEYDEGQLLHPQAHYLDSSHAPDGRRYNMSYAPDSITSTVTSEVGPPPQQLEHYSQQVSAASAASAAVSAVSRANNRSHHHGQGNNSGGTGHNMNDDNSNTNSMNSMNSMNSSGSNSNMNNNSNSGNIGNNNNNSSGSTLVRKRNNSVIYLSFSSKDNSEVGIDPPGKRRPSQQSAESTSSAVSSNGVRRSSVFQQVDPQVLTSSGNLTDSSEPISEVQPIPNTSLLQYRTGDTARYMTPIKQQKSKRKSRTNRYHIDSADEYSMDSKEKRLLRNRLSAQASRNRKKEQVIDLQYQVTNLQLENRKLEEMNSHLMAQLDDMRRFQAHYTAQIAYLQRLNADKMSSVPLRSGNSAVTAAALEESVVAAVAATVETTASDSEPLKHASVFQPSTSTMSTASTASICVASTAVTTTTTTTRSTGQSQPEEVNTDATSYVPNQY